jgi:hypothetical protein
MRYLSEGCSMDCALKYELISKVEVSNWQEYGEGLKAYADITYSARTRTYDPDRRLLGPEEVTVWQASEHADISAEELNVNDEVGLRALKRSRKENARMGVVEFVEGAEGSFVEWPEPWAWAWGRPSYFWVYLMEVMGWVDKFDVLITPTRPRQIEEAP